MFLMIKKGLDDFTEAVLDLFSPPVCFLCWEPTHRKRRALCWACLRKPLLGAEEKLCAVCFGRMTGAGDTCGECEQKRPAFEQARAAALFAGDVRKLVHLYKYRRALWLCNDFSDWLHGCFLTHYNGVPFDCIVPVPVTLRKLLTRHYNQSEFLARELGRRVDLPCLPRALARRGGLVTQTTLTRHERASNVARAFRVRQPKKIAGRRILLLDDVFTTGATANACARELRRAGAKSVHVITVARGMLD